MIKAPFTREKNREKGTDLKDPDLLGTIWVQSTSIYTKPDPNKRLHGNGPKSNRFFKHAQ